MEFSATMLKISSRTSLLTGFSADRLPTRETNPQYNWKTARCQRTTVSGDTRMSAVFREGQRRRKTTLKSLSPKAGPGAGVLTFE